MNKLIKDFKNTMIFLKGRYIPYLAGIIGMAVCYAASSILQSYLLKRLIDGGASANIITLAKLAILIITYILVILFLLPQFTFLFNVNAKYGHGNLNKAIYEKFGKLPTEYYERNHSGKILSYILNDAWSVAAIFMRHFKRTITAIATILIYLIPMIIYDYRITSIIFVLNLLTLYINMHIAKILKSRTRTIQKEMGTMVEIISNIIGGMSVVKMYQLSKNMRATFAQNNRELLELNDKNNRLQAFLVAYNFMISILNTVVFIVLGAVLVQHGLTTYGNIIAIFSLQTVLDENFREFATYFPPFYNGLASTERVYEFLEESEEVGSHKLGIIEEPEYIEFKNVCFGYQEDNYVLEKFNLKVRRGEMLALIGESGSGKSSIVKLLLGYYLPQSGSIAVNGKNLTTMTLNELRDLIAYVPQEATLFNTSIIENIRYGRLTATDEEVVEAARLANAHAFIMEQENGYQTITGEKGTRLSGGQRQRIAIARAILKNAPILLLDEATSSLDNESEALIKESLDAYGKTRTTIMIAHRLTTIENADRIFNMNSLSYEK